MRWIYLISVWLHVMAAIVWIGGMLFLAMVVVPWLRTGDRARAGVVLRDTGRRFSRIAWVCFALLFGTGLVNLAVRGVRPADLVDAQWLATPFGLAIGLKLLLFVVVLGLSVFHDFRLGPQATAALARDPRAPEAERLRRIASRMGRVNALLALLLVALGVVVVRGWP